jgi:hypothetical protein
VSLPKITVSRHRSLVLPAQAAPDSGISMFVLYCPIEVDSATIVEAAIPFKFGSSHGINTVMEISGGVV